MHSINYMPIAPINVLKENKFDFNNQYRSHVMILAHLCESNSIYTTFYQNTNKYRKFILLDNGAAENSQINNEKLLEKIELIKPTCVIAPDILFDGEKTIEHTFEFIKLLKENKIKVKVMAVPHGKNIEEYYKTFEVFNNSKDIDWIGISKFVSVKPFTDRITCMLNLSNKVKHFNKNIHILGCNNPVEISFIRNFKKVKSIDSCIAYLYNDQEVPLDNSINKRLDTPHDFFDKILTEQQIEQAHKNIIKIDNLCNF